MGGDRSDVKWWEVMEFKDGRCYCWWWMAIQYDMGDGDDSLWCDKNMVGNEIMVVMYSDEWWNVMPMRNDGLVINSDGGWQWQGWRVVMRVMGNDRTEVVMVSNRMRGGNGEIGGAWWWCGVLDGDELWVVMVMMVGSSMWWAGRCGTHTHTPTHRDVYCYHTSGQPTFGGLGGWLEVNHPPSS